MKIKKYQAYYNTTRLRSEGKDRSHWKFPAKFQAPENEKEDPTRIWIKHRGDLFKQNFTLKSKTIGISKTEAMLSTISNGGRIPIYRIYGRKGAYDRALHF